MLQAYGVKIVVGVVLIAAAIAVPFLAPGIIAGFGIFSSTAMTASFITAHALAIGTLGAAIALYGVSSALTPRPQLDGNSYNNREQADQRTSFLFNGPTNTSQQGLPIPVVYATACTQL